RFWSRTCTCRCRKSTGRPGSGDAEPVAPRPESARGALERSPRRLGPRRHGRLLQFFQEFDCFLGGFGPREDAGHFFQALLDRLFPALALADQHFELVELEHRVALGVNVVADYGHSLRLAWGRCGYARLGLVGEEVEPL